MDEGAAMTDRIAYMAIAISLALLTVSCAERNPGVFITANILPSSDCLVTPDGARLFGGVLDTGLAQATNPTSPYVVYPLYQNQLQNRASLAPLRSDANGFSVLGAKVELIGADGRTLALPGGLVNPYTISAGESTYVPSAAGNEVVSQPGALEIIPSQYVEALDTIVQDTGGGFNLVAIVTAFGVTSGDNNIELNDWQWSIRVMRLGLIDFVSGDDPETAEVCDAPEPPGVKQCKPLGTDQVVDCRYCKFSGNAEVAACCGQGHC